MSHHRTVHLKYLRILFVDYTLINLGGEKENHSSCHREMGTWGPQWTLGTCQEAVATTQMRKNQGGAEKGHIQDIR